MADDLSVDLRIDGVDLMVRLVRVSDTGWRESLAEAYLDLKKLGDAIDAARSAAEGPTSPVNNGE